MLTNLINKLKFGLKTSVFMANVALTPLTLIKGETYQPTLNETNNHPDSLDSKNRISPLIEENNPPLPALEEMPPIITNQKTLVTKAPEIPLPSLNEILPPEKPSFFSDQDLPKQPSSQNFDLEYKLAFGISIGALIAFLLFLEYPSQKQNVKRVHSPALNSIDPKNKLFPPDIPVSKGEPPFTKNIAQETDNPKSQGDIKLSQLSREDMSDFLNGVEKLARYKNKLKQEALAKRKRGLQEELKSENISQERQKAIHLELDEIAKKRKELNQERLKAYTLIKGKTGEQINELKRQYAKKMRKLSLLIKKEGKKNAYETEKERINLLLQHLRQTEKTLILRGKKALSNRKQEREDKAKAIHALRLLHEAKLKQANLDAEIKLWKKETGYKKKEILQGNPELEKDNKQINEFKKKAKRLLKDRFINQQKRAIKKEIKQAILNKDIEKEKLLLEKLTSLKTEEKNILNQVQSIDYISIRKEYLNPNIYQKIQEKKEAIKIKKEREQRAKFLRGQRMLYHLQNGLSSAINNNKISPTNYRKAALQLLGKRTLRFDYAKYRSLFLKANVFWNIRVNRYEHKI